jgi:hypothetical protein
VHVEVRHGGEIVEALDSLGADGRLYLLGEADEGLDQRQPGGVVVDAGPA